MAKIIPSSSLKKRYEDISDFCNKYNEPVFITKKGSGDLVLMSNTAYEELSGRMELHRLLDEGLASLKNGGGRDAKSFFTEAENEFANEGI